MLQITNTVPPLTHCRCCFGAHILNWFNIIYLWFHSFPETIRHISCWSCLSAVVVNRSSANVQHFDEITQRYTVTFLIWPEFQQGLPKLAVMTLPLLSEACVVVVGSWTNTGFGMESGGVEHSDAGQGVCVSVWGLCPLSFPVLKRGQYRFWLYSHRTDSPPHTVCLYTHTGMSVSFIMHSLVKNKYVAMELAYKAKNSYFCCMWFQNMIHLSRHFFCGHSTGVYSSVSATHLEFTHFTFSLLVYLLKFKYLQ